MPTYEYRCQQCGEKFARIEKMRDHEDARPACPECESEDVRQVMSAFFAQTSSKS